jgi:hypothetical protein
MYDCPKKNSLDSDGTCKGPIPGNPGDAGCNAYCEIKIRFKYGREQPYQDVDPCRYNDDCTIHRGESFSNTTGWTISTGIDGGMDPDASALKAGFSLGATYSWSETYTSTVSKDYKRPPGEIRCGYWTWVPWLMTCVLFSNLIMDISANVIRSCGTLTQANMIKQDWCEGEGESTCSPNDKRCDKDQLISVGNWCNDAPVTYDNGGSAGQTIFVATGCDGDQSPESDGQDWIYYQPGVSNDKDYHGNVSTARNPPDGPPPPAGGGR